MKRETALALHLRYLTLKLRALCWVLRRLRAGGDVDDRGEPATTP